MSPGMICRITALPAPAGEISALAAPERATFWSSGRRIWDRWVGTRCGAVLAALAALVIGIVLVGCWPLLTPLVATRHSLGFRLFFATAFGAAATFATAFALAFAPDFALGLAVAVTTRTSPGAYSFHLTRGGQQPQMFIHERARRYCQVQILH